MGVHRFALFIDGSNLHGSLRAMNLQVSDYEAFYSYLYRLARQEWHRVTLQEAPAPAQLRRVYWYEVGSMDEWDLALPQSQAALREAFKRDKATHDLWVQAVCRAENGLTPSAAEDKAWDACFSDFRAWYETKRTSLASMRRFHQGVRNSTDLIDVIEAGHWKVDFVRKALSEKGLDTSLAVDMVALQDGYDVAVIVSGDADSIPSITYMKGRNKHVAAVEFVNGSPPEQKGRSFSSRLRDHADFVIRVYETELIRLKLAARPSKVGLSPELGD
jgi:uncharacterized LabA/DUF88 family protein